MLRVRNGPTTTTSTTVPPGPTTTTEVGTEPTLNVEVLAPVCDGDAPYLVYRVSPPGVSANTVTITFVNPHSASYTVSSLFLAGRLLSPGAVIDADGHPTDWPGWTQRSDGTSAEGDEWDWATGEVSVLTEVNPHATRVVDYPPATPQCTAGPRPRRLCTGRCAPPDDALLSAHLRCSPIREGVGGEHRSMAHAVLSHFPPETETLHASNDPVDRHSRHRHSVPRRCRRHCLGLDAAVHAGAAMAGPTGPLCAAVPADGEGSVSGMADDPVGTAASNNPLLSTLVAAVTAANLGDTLNGAGPFTVFAPVNSAFDKIPADTLQSVLGDVPTLTSILTYHVLPEQLSGADLVAGGTFTTVNGADLTVDMVNDTLVINGGAAAVQCADVPTANATVFLIDTVLMPPMASTPATTAAG